MTGKSEDEHQSDDPIQLGVDEDNPLNIGGADLSSEEISEEDAEKAFAAGFDTIAPGDDTPPAKGEPGAETKPAEEAGEAEDKADPGAVDDGGQAPEAGKGGETETTAGKEPIADEVEQANRALKKQLRDMKGQMGSLQQQIREMREAQQGRTETQEEEDRRRELQEQLDSVVTEFNEIAPLKDVIVGLSERVDQLEGGSKSALTSDDLARSEMQILESFHPDWEELGRSKEFQQFAYNGGPTQEEVGQLNLLLNDPAKQAEADALVQEWSEDYPAWWGERGKLMCSNNVAHQVQLLTNYKSAVAERQSEEQQALARKNRRESRLASNVGPKTSGGDSVKGESEEAAFAAGFRSASGK